MRILLHDISDVRELKVYDTAELYGVKGRYRVLEFSDQAVQGAMDLDDPARIVLEYPRAIIHLMDANHPDFEAAFLIGHGIGTIVRHYAGRRMTAAEVDPRVAELACTYFGSEAESVRIGDGRELLEWEAADTLDYMIVDAFTKEGTPRHLVSAEFFKMASEKLHDQGAVIMNLIGRGTKDPYIRAIHTTLQTVFAYTKAFFLSDRRTDMQNIILIGAAHPIRYQERHMAGFREAGLDEGYIITDRL
ncbi:fused MFS/spermidine synthase [Paenibacillus sp. FSL M8-0334]|uniref:Spermidine synthase n=1 Tax=Paenibacillus campinasensis TaxID=66347 RepID=A0ABW9T1C9_9BACL|nr:fused MFS/spermidine synthase [Paenibacillus campinasensis]MUG67098.1 spermidine synthase [Paenibacillus campinasensis]